MTQKVSVVIKWLLTYVKMLVAFTPQFLMNGALDSMVTGMPKVSLDQKAQTPLPSNRHLLHPSWQGLQGMKNELSSHPYDTSFHFEGLSHMGKVFAGSLL